MFARHASHLPHPRVASSAQGTLAVLAVTVASARVASNRRPAPQTQPVMAFQPHATAHRLIANRTVLVLALYLLMRPHEHGALKAIPLAYVKVDLRFSRATQPGSLQAHGTRFGYAILRTPLSKARKTLSTPIVVQPVSTRARAAAMPWTRVCVFVLQHSTDTCGGVKCARAVAVPIDIGPVPAVAATSYQTLSSALAIGARGRCAVSHGWRAMPG